MLQLPLRKLVVELRYKPDLGFYGKMDAIAGSFGSEFPDWERSPLTVEVRNKKKHRRVFLGYRRCFFESDLGNVELAPEFDFAQESLGRVSHELAITEFARLGVRQWFAADLTKAFALMVDELRDRFFSVADQVSAILTDTPEDLAYVVDYKTKEGWKYALRFGPMTRMEWFRRVFYEPGIFDESDDDRAASIEQYRLSLPDTFLFIDIDSHQEAVPATQLSERITAFRRHTHELVLKLVKHCKE